MNPTPDQIDKYLRNEMSHEEMISFKSALDKDPILKEEVSFNESIKHGLAEYRTSELKARLNAIDVSTVPWFGAGQFGEGILMKTVGAVVTASIIGVGSYFMIVDEEPVVEVSEQNVRYVTDIDYPVNYDSFKLDFESISEIIISESIRSTPELIIEKPASSSVISESTEEKTSTRVDFVPSVSIPELNDLEDDNSLSVSHVDVPEITGMDEVSIEDREEIEVETVNKSGESLKYKYFDGKLYLFGDFKGLTYEILEINRTTEKDLYLIFNDKYYQINALDQVQNLLPIENETLLGELSIIRNNKE